MMHHSLTTLTMDQALQASADGSLVVMIDLDVFESIHEIRFMTIDDIVNLDNTHDVIYLRIER